MIRFSAFLVAVAVGLLVAGVVTSRLALVYGAIGVSGVALLALGVGVLIKRRELFGQPEPAQPELKLPEPGLAQPEPAVAYVAPGQQSPGSRRLGLARGPRRVRVGRCARPPARPAPAPPPVRHDAARFDRLDPQRGRTGDPAPAPGTPPGPRGPRGLRGPRGPRDTTGSRSPGAPCRPRAPCRPGEPGEPAGPGTLRAPDRGHSRGYGRLRAARGRRARHPGAGRSASGRREPVPGRRPRPGR